MARTVWSTTTTTQRRRPRPTARRWILVTTTYGWRWTNHTGSPWGSRLVVWTWRSTTTTKQRCRPRLLPEGGPLSSRPTAGRRTRHMGRRWRSRPMAWAWWSTSTTTWWWRPMRWSLVIQTRPGPWRSRLKAWTCLVEHYYQMAADRHAPTARSDQDLRLANGQVLHGGHADHDLYGLGGAQMEVKIKDGEL